MARAPPVVLTRLEMVVVRHSRSERLGTLSCWFGWEGSTPFTRRRRPGRSHLRNAEDRLRLVRWRGH